MARPPLPEGRRWAWWLVDSLRARAPSRRGRPGARPRRLAARADAVASWGAFFELAPDWVCEVLSPSTTRIDRGRKLRIYARAGVPHAWLVNPQDRTLEVLRLRDGAWTIVAVWEDAAVVRAEPFEAMELDLGPFWAQPPTPPLARSRCDLEGHASPMVRGWFLAIITAYIPDPSERSPDFRRRVD